MDTSQLEIWRGEFGNDYFERSRVDIALRADAFSTILQGLHLSSVLEVGCGLGQNLQALVRSGLVQSVKGVEPSLYARELPHPGLVIVNGSCFSIPFADIIFAIEHSVIHLSVIDSLLYQIQMIFYYYFFQSIFAAVIYR